MADVESGDPPRAIRPQFAEAEVSPEVPQHAVPPESVARPAAKRPRRASRGRKVPSPAGPAAPERAGDSGARQSSAFSEDVLSLEGSSAFAGFDPDPGADGIPVWRRGLRG